MKKIINTPDAPAPIGPYNQAVQTGDMLFISNKFLTVILPLGSFFHSLINFPISSSTLNKPWSTAIPANKHEGKHFRQGWL